MKTILVLLSLFSIAFAFSTLQSVNSCASLSPSSTLTDPDVAASYETTCVNSYQSVPGVGNEQLQNPCVACVARKNWNSNPSKPTSTPLITVTCQPFDQMGLPITMTNQLCDGLSSTNGRACDAHCTQPLQADIPYIQLCHNACANPVSSMPTGCDTAPVWQQLNISSPDAYIAKSCAVLISRNQAANANLYPQFVGNGALFRDYYGNCGTATPSSC